ncbi:MAG: NUDIX domain-containing protein [bacterium]
MPHIHEKIDFVVAAWIIHNNRVLLVFHKGQQTWLPIGGHIELDEDPQEALYREVKEECGLEIEVVGQTKNPDYPSGIAAKLLLTPAFLDIHPINSIHRHVALGYFAKAKSGAVHLAKNEHDEIRWFALSELDEPRYNILPDIKFFAKEALRRVK